MTPTPANTLEVYDLLAAVDNAAADKMILCALPRLERSHSRMALEVLIRRRRLGALVKLVAGFAGYPEPLRVDILTHVGSLEHALRVVIQHEDPGTRAGAIKLIAASGDCRLAYLLNTALSQPSPATRKQAGKTLLIFAEQHLARRSKVTDAESAARVEAEGRHLAAALGRAIQCWELHLRTEVLTAAVWLADLLESTIAEKVAQPRSRLDHALNALLSTQPHPRFAGYALRALTVSDLRTRAARVVGLCQDDVFMTALIDESWLLKDARVRRGCSSIHELRWLSRSIDPLLRLDKSKAASAMRFIGATGLPSGVKVELFSDVIASGDAYLRRAALWQLVDVGTEFATKALRRVARHGDCSVAEMARHELHRRAPESSTPRAVLRSPTSGIATNAAKETLPDDARLDEFFSAFASLDEDRRRFALQDPLLKTPAAARYLRTRLASSDADERARALQIVCLADLVGEMEEQLYRLAHDPDAIVRGNAVTALCRIPNPAAVRILRRSLQDPDSRVQANAIEALDHLEVDRYDEWIESKLESPSSRVRANAVKALLKCEVRRAADVLIEMLDSEVRGERLSALWVVQRLNLTSLTDRLNRLARDDSDAQVRRRAADIVKTVAPWHTWPEEHREVETSMDTVEP